MKKKLSTATLLLILATICVYGQGSKNINRAYGITTSDAKGMLTIGTICFYDYKPNGPELLTYYYTNAVTKARATASFTYVGNTGTPPNVYTMKGRDEAVLERQDFKIVVQLLDKNKMSHTNGVTITETNPQSAAMDVKDFGKTE